MFEIPMLLACGAAFKRISGLFLGGEPQLWPAGHP